MSWKWQVSAAFFLANPVQTRSKTVQPRILNSLLRLIAVPDPLVYQLFVSMLFRTRSLCYLVSASCRVGVTRYMELGKRETSSQCSPRRHRPRPTSPMRLAVATLALCCSALAFQAAPRHVSASSVSTRVSAPIFAREGDKDGMSGAVGGAVLGGLLAGP